VVANKLAASLNALPLKLAFRVCSVFVLCGRFRVFFLLLFRRFCGLSTIDRWLARGPVVGSRLVVMSLIKPIATLGRSANSIAESKAAVLSLYRYVRQFFVLKVAAVACTVLIVFVAAVHAVDLQKDAMAHQHL